ncbi:MAG: hypothetical protein KKF46_02955 [Nanoarchaeota archaeon]|nr:hypothetical protein [Nanoarchaeota archaeon]MBU1321292.1 hypothetical protein [Nanoarchaeota archaeon]MBU1597461.1 hypothetical protein [Nanoarchaeota archaeon]MBU2441464.1 hypothetical protein [Nanoarchaeota archaeon]
MVSHGFLSLALGTALLAYTTTVYAIKPNNEISLDSDLASLIENNHKPSIIDISDNYSVERKLYLSVGLDCVAESRAKELLRPVLSDYKLNFNIDIVIQGFYDYTLPYNWNFWDEGKKLKATACNESDIYLFLTSNNWESPDRKADEDTDGQAISSLGLTWEAVSQLFLQFPFQKKK